MGFRWAIRWGGSHGETCSEGSSALGVTGRLLMSRTVLEHFGVLDVDPELTVDTAATAAHLRCMTTPAGGVHRSLSTSAPAQRKPPRSRRLAGTGRPVPVTHRDQLTPVLRTLGTARWGRSGTAVSNTAGRTVAHRYKAAPGAPVPDNVRRRVDTNPWATRRCTGCTAAASAQVTRCRRISGTVCAPRAGVTGAAPDAAPRWAKHR